MAEINSTAQAASALTGVSDVLSPVFTLWYLQKNITTDIAPYVTRVTYSDNIKSESDTIEVELDDTDGRWLDKWYPGKGDTLTLKMGYQGEKLLSCGTFSIDEIEVSSPASVVAIRGVATSVNNALRTKSSRGFESTTLAAIAGRIAKKHQLKLVGSIEAIRSTVVPVPKKMVEPSSISSTERRAICNFSSACFVRFSLCEYSWRSIACGRPCALRAPPCTRSISPRLASSSRSRRIVISETPNASEISLTETVPCSSSSCRTLSCRSALITMSPRCSTLTSIQTITNKLYQTRARQK